MLMKSRNIIKNQVNQNMESTHFYFAMQAKQTPHTNVFIAFSYDYREPDCYQVKQHITCEEQRL